MALTAFNMLPVLYGGEPCIGQDLSCTDQYTWSQEEADRASAYTLLSLAMLGTGGFISGYGLAKRYENGASVDE